MPEHRRSLLAAVGVLVAFAGDPVRCAAESAHGGSRAAEAALAGGASTAEPIVLLGEVGPALAAALASLTQHNDDRGYLAPPKELRASYRGALDLLGREKFERACEALVWLESPVSRSARPESMEVLAEAELAVTLRLAELDADAIYPLVTMHGELAGQYLRLGHGQLASHSIQMATRIATLFATSAGGSSARETAAGALATLAAGLTKEGPVTAVLGLLRDALAIDPDSAPALAMMAAHLERSGKPEEAIPYLRRLVAAHPDCSEGALHLAVCLRRTGGEVPAGLLESCLDPAALPWVRAVAYDELARRSLDRSDWNGAIAVLSEAVQARPDLIGPRIQLAYAYDRAARSTDGLAAIEGVTAAAPQAGSPPRRTYGQPVPETVRRERDRVAQATRLHLAALAAVLARTTAPPEA